MSALVAFMAGSCVLLFYRVFYLQFAPGRDWVKAPCGQMNVVWQACEFVMFNQLFIAEKEKHEIILRMLRRKNKSQVRRSDANRQGNSGNERVEWTGRAVS
ncbi:hypothetical protein [Thalassospira alkalitolerans]|uniref:hypothetical protein n=1 Tax=Thalassospira alkalitolerans TaxID=1293890 RepID=UPI003AA84076